MKNNLRQGAGLKSKQYKQAFDNVRILLKTDNITRANLQLTGHSLGGGMASAVGTLYGIYAITFNAAGVHKNTLARRGGHIEFAKASVNSYYLTGDILTFEQEQRIGTRFIPDAIGNRIELVVEGFAPLRPPGKTYRQRGRAQHEGFDQMLERM